MENTLILCGGTGAHTMVAFLRLHTLGHALGFFERDGKPLDFPTVYLIDQDAGDGAERPTAWQLAKSLVAQHPARRNWTRAIGRSEPPELISVTPLPVGQGQEWFQRPYNTLDTRFESSELPPLLASKLQREIDFSKGMMGSPALGSLLFRLKEYDERSRGLNRDETYGQLLQSEGRIVVAGSGVGGTGASVAPTIAEQLAGAASNPVMAVMILEWFEFEQDVADEATRARAQQRNRLMRENAHSALEFYGRSLSRRVAAVPVGMPDKALVKRTFTGDVGQPIKESFIHAVGALSGYRHFLKDEPYGPGLYMMGATERGRLDGATPIPGGTLQGLANQAATVADLLEIWRKTLARTHDGRVRPAIYDAVAKITGQPAQVADHLATELEHYREQLQWLEEVVKVKGSANKSFSREAASRERLLHDRKKLPVHGDAPPEEVASALFQWTAEWVRESASTQNSLEVQPADVDGGQWPDLRNDEGLGVSADVNGDLNRIDDANRDAVIEAFVRSEHVSANGWPHPLAAADYFRHAVRRRDKKALRQLELLLVGVVSGELELQNIYVPQGADEGVTLERMVTDFRREGWKGLVDLAVVDPSHGNRPIAFASPYTLFAPVPFMNEDEDHRRWNELWQKLSGATDGADWVKADEPETWGDHDMAVRQVVAWIEQQKRARPTSPPPWTRVFDRHRGREAGVMYGHGSRVRVLWGASGEADRPLVELHLPTQEVGTVDPPEGTETVEANELVGQVPDLMELRDQGGQLQYSAVEIRVPGRDSTVWGWWEDHLKLLQERGQIHLCYKDRNGAVILTTLENGNPRHVRVANSRFLNRQTIATQTCTPLEQDPVPGSTRGEGQILYPDLPLKADYIDLVQLEDGRSLLDVLANGDRFGQGQWQPATQRDTDGRRVIRWNFRLRGLPDPMTVELRLAPDTKPHKAHWMVWPRFRSRGQGGWRTYYVYEDHSHPRHRLDTIWLDWVDQPVFHRRVAEGDAVSYPVSYRTGGDHPAHVGGPPLAVSLRDKDNDKEEGLYLVPLEVLAAEDVEVDVAVDFGTSHSVAAYRVGDGPVASVEFAAELHKDTVTNPDKGAITLHLSENWSQVQASEAELGILETGSWFPTYTSERRGMLPSELVLAKPLSGSQADQISRWEPATDYLIPPVDIARSNLSQFVLSDFKWDVGESYFRGREAQLQEHYLALFLELTLAEIVAHRCHAFPRAGVNLTFTYPLRNTKNQVKRYQESLKQVLLRCGEGMGLALRLKDGEGIFDESRAARLTSDTFGEVCLVGDLGGGTLDLFIAAQPKGDKDFPEVADSVKLGGNLLLRRIAQNPEEFLPADGNWRNGSDQRDTETKLRAWMRSVGAPALFGIEAGDRTRMPRVEVRSFGNAAHAEKGRILLDRYFRLVVEYLARNLTAYLVRYWFPKVSEDERERLKISVQLRGNGWRLRYQDQSYEQATAAVQAMVRQRVVDLWDRILDNDYPKPDADRFWAEASRYPVDDPKIDPIKGVVEREPTPHEEVWNRWHSHTLVELEVERKDDGAQQVAWWERIPFDTGGSKHVEVREISPPLPLSSASLDEQLIISSLDARGTSAINGPLKKEADIDPETGMYRAPVAPLVWEAVFNSSDFWPSR